MNNLSFLEKAPILKTKRLILRSFSDADLEAAIEILDNDEIKQTFMLPDFSCRQEIIAMFNFLKNRSFDNDHFVYGIYLDNKLIGFINDVEIIDSSIEIGYVIHPSKKNQGYATEMLKAVIQELFRINYTEVKAGFFEENIASKRVMEKCGMKKTNQNIDIEYRNKTHHCIYYSIHI